MTGSPNRVQGSTANAAGAFGPGVRPAMLCRDASGQRQPFMRQHFGRDHHLDPQDATRAETCPAAKLVQLHASEARTPNHGRSQDDCRQDMQTWGLILYLYIIPTKRSIKHITIIDSRYSRYSHFARWTNAQGILCLGISNRDKGRGRALRIFRPFITAGFFVITDRRQRFRGIDTITCPISHPIFVRPFHMRIEQDGRCKFMSRNLDAERRIDRRTRHLIGGDERCRPFWTRIIEPCIRIRCQPEHIADGFPGPTDVQTAPNWFIIIGLCLAEAQNTEARSVLNTGFKG